MMKWSEGREVAGSGVHLINDEENLMYISLFALCVHLQDLMNKLIVNFAGLFVCLPACLSVSFPQINTQHNTIFHHLTCHLQTFYIQYVSVFSETPKSLFYIGCIFRRESEREQA